MTSGVIIAVLAATVATVALGVILAGIWWRRRLRAKNPSSPYLFRVTGTGIAIYALMVCAFVVAAVMKHLAPGTWFGGYLNVTGGLAIAFVGIALAFVPVSWGLEKLGYPMTKKMENGDV